MHAQMCSCLFVYMYLSWQGYLCGYYLLSHVSNQIASFREFLVNNVIN